MGWATTYIEKLRNGEVVSFRPKGHSMMPKIKSGQLCTVAPVDTPLEKGDIVLCKVNGREYLHLIKACASNGESYQIGNAHGHVNGWTGKALIYGRLVSVSD